MGKTYELDGDHVHCDFGELLARTLLNELAKIWSQRVHQNLSLLVRLDLGDDHREADAWLRVLILSFLLPLVLLEVVQHGLLLEIALQVLLLVNF